MKVERGGSELALRDLNATATVIFLSPLSLLSSALLLYPLLSLLLSLDIPECGGLCGELTRLFIICIPIPILEAVRVSVEGYF